MLSAVIFEHGNTILLFSVTQAVPTCRTPSGSPASFAMAASSIVAPGSFSDGFRIMVLPHTAAMGNIQRGIMAGKLKGQMPAVTPSGCLFDNLNIEEGRWMRR